MLLHRLLQHLSTTMPLQNVLIIQTSKRKRITSAEAISPDSPSQTPTDNKQLLHLSSRLSPEIWDNLSHIWLTPSAIHEFDRRTVQLVRPKRKKWPHLKGYSVKDPENFARRGGLSLCDLRGVSSSSVFL